MKYFSAILLILFASNLVLAQNEQASIVEKEIKYKDWTYKSVRTGEDQNLRDYIIGKKLVMVVYFAPWCHNWRHDAPILRKLYDKYQSDGLGIIAVGLYDPVEAMQANLDALNIAFPVVYESADRESRQTSLHYKYRRSTGDERKWGSPWYIFLTPAQLEKKGDTLTKKTFVINGEIIEAEGERFIRTRLGLPASEAKVGIKKNGELEVCDPDKPAAELIKP